MLTAGERLATDLNGGEKKKMERGIKEREKKMGAEKWEERNGKREGIGWWWGWGVGGGWVGGGGSSARDSLEQSDEWVRA